MRGIAGLVGIMIAMVVGVSLIGSITSTTKEITDATTTVTTTNTLGATGITTTPAYSSTVSGIAGVLPIILVAVILLGAVAWIGGSEGFGFSIPWFHKKETEDKSAVKEQARLNNASLRLRCVEASNSLSQYINNLDAYLGIKTQRVKSGELSLVGSNLYISRPTEEDGDYDWYITAKYPTEPAFKVVGLNKSNPDRNLVYTLGKNSVTGTPFLFQETDTNMELVRLDKVSIPAVAHAGWLVDKAA